jgi:hypothetical protein
VFICHGLQAHFAEVFILRGLLVARHLADSAAVREKAGRGANMGYASTVV